MNAMACRVVTFIDPVLCAMQGWNGWLPARLSRDAGEAPGAPRGVAHDALRDGTPLARYSIAM